MTYSFSGLLFLLLLALSIESRFMRILTDLNEEKYRVPKTLVLTFDHCAQSLEALDPFIGTNKPVYYHIVTPLQRGDHVMFRYDLVGFSYGAVQAMDITWCGYNGNNPFVAKVVNVNRNENLYKLPLKSYYKKDGTLVLSFGPINRYCNGFELYYQGHYRKYRKGLDRDQYKIIVSYNDHELT